MKIILFAIAAVFAVSATTASAQFVPGLGEVTNEGRVEFGAGSTSLQEVYFDANRSYECSAISDSTVDTVRLLIRDGLGGALDTTANSVENIGDATPIITSGLSGATNDDNRFTLTPVAAGKYQLIFDNTSFVTSQRVKVGCVETTIYGGFNTNANPYNFLELTNITNQPITGRVRGFNYDGTATVDSTFTIAANTRFDIDVHTAAGANKYGILIVTHNAPYGGLKGMVSQYSGTPSALELRATIPLKSREQSF